MQRSNKENKTSNVRTGATDWNVCGTKQKKYIPPHLRNRQFPDDKRRFPGPGNDGRFSRPGGNDGRFSHSSDGRSSCPGGNDGRFSRPGGNGRRHQGGTRRKRYPTMERDERLEKKLFPQKKSTGIAFEQYNHIPVDVSGKDVPPPVKKFEDGKFHEVLLSNIDLAGYVDPTPIQQYSIPITLADRDLMATAQTGSGKTAAFLFPVLSLLLTTDIQSNKPRQYGYRRTHFPSALILTPTRELATQIYGEARKFTYRTGLFAVAIYGGQRMGEQIRAMERGGCDLVIATPGRLMDMLERGILSLACIKFLILDEADRMLDMGFERDIRAIVSGHDMPAKRQTSMFSATFPTNIQRLAADFLDNYIFLAVGRVGSATQNITQKVVYTGMRDQDKDEALLKILSQCEGLTIVFVETKRSADWLENNLVNYDINAVAIHGDRNQQERERALDLFRSERCPVLVATSVAARGLDIPNVLTVINYDLPSKMDDYVHRIGRTGRAGHQGTAFAFVNERSRALQDLLHILQDSKQDVEPWFLDLVQASQTGRHKGRRKTPNTHDYRHGSNSHGSRHIGGVGGYNRVGPLPTARPQDKPEDFPVLGKASLQPPRMQRVPKSTSTTIATANPAATATSPSSSTASSSMGTSGKSSVAWSSICDDEDADEDGCNDAW